MAERLEIIITAKDNASKVIKNIGDISKGAFKVGLGVAAGGVIGLGAAFAGLLKGEMEMEAELAELNAVLESTNSIAGITTEEALALASAFQKTTRFTDDQVISAESMLLTFTNISDNVFPAATEATLNLAEKFGSIDQASTMLGKALNDPIQGVAALRRVGIQLTEQQEEQIKTYMALGDIESAQKVILGELETQFGGLAEAMGQTTEGKLTRFKNLLEDAAGSIVELALPALSGLLDKVLGGVMVIGGFTERIARLIEVVTKFGMDSSQAAGMFQWAFGPEMGETLYKIAGVVGGVIDVFKDLVSAIIGFVSDHGPAFRNMLLVLGAVIGGAAVLGGVLSLAGAIAALANPITAIIAAMALLVMAWTEDWGGIRTTLTETWEKYIKPVADDLKAWLDKTLPVAINAAVTAWNTVLKPALKTLFNFIADDLLPTLGNVAWWFTSVIGAAIDVATPFLNAVAAVFDLIKQAVAAIPNVINGFIGALNKIHVPAGLQAVVDAIKTILGAPGWIIDQITGGGGGGGQFYGTALNEHDVAALLAKGLPVPEGPRSQADQSSSAAMARQGGGHVRSGVPYLVGERGPELFVPNAGGRIRPNHRLGAGNTFNLTVYSNATSEHIIRDFGVMKTWVGS